MLVIDLVPIFMGISWTRLHFGIVIEGAKKILEEYKSISNICCHDKQWQAGEWL